MSEYVIKVDENDKRWYYVEQQYTHFFGYPITEEIVRCRDCKHYDRMNDDEGMCMVPDDDGDYARWMVDAVGYCYLGERRGE